MSNQHVFLSAYESVEIDQSIHFSRYSSLTIRSLESMI